MNQYIALWTRVIVDYLCRFAEWLDPLPTPDPVADPRDERIRELLDREIALSNDLETAHQDAANTLSKLTATESAAQQVTEALLKTERLFENELKRFADELKELDALVKKESAQAAQYEAEVLALKSQLNEAELEITRLRLAAITPDPVVEQVPVYVDRVVVREAPTPRTRLSPGSASRSRFAKLRGYR